MKVINFPADEGKFAYILDGQHRLEGFKYSDGVKFDLPVVAIYNADETVRGRSSLTSTASRSRSATSTLLLLYYQIKDLPVDQASVMDVITKLNENDDSPLKGRIKMMDDDKGWWSPIVG